MNSKVTKAECLYALQENQMSLKDANKIYDFFINKGIDFLMLEFICATLEDDPFRFHSVLADLEEEENV